jgi:hypothetical protein
MAIIQINGNNLMIVNATSEIIYLAARITFNVSINSTHPIAKEMRLKFE